MRDSAHNVTQLSYHQLLACRQVANCLGASVSKLLKLDLVTAAIPLSRLAVCCRLAVCFTSPDLEATAAFTHIHLLKRAWRWEDALEAALPLLQVATDPMLRIEVCYVAGDLCRNLGQSI